MPVWLEVLLNVVGYAGFVGIAMFNNAAEKPAAGQPRPRCCVS